MIIDLVFIKFEFTTNGRTAYIAMYHDIRIELEVNLTDNYLCPDIDPAIATVPHLLDLLRTARDQNSVLQIDVEDLTRKVSNE